MRYVKRFTVREWKRFEGYTDDIVDGQSLTMQEIILQRYDVILTDHVNRRKVGKMIKPTFKENMKKFASKLTQKNLDAGLAAFDKGMADFDREMTALSKGLGGSGKKHKLWSDKKTDLKLFSVQEKKKPRKKSGKKQPSQDELNMDKIWGKSRNPR